MNDKLTGYSLEFAIEVSPTLAQALGNLGLGTGSPIFAGAFFYADGVEGFRGFAGRLPGAITFGDSTDDLVAKLGPPKFEIRNKKTGSVTSRRWDRPRGRLTVKYRGEAMTHVALGLF